MQKSSKVENHFLTPGRDLTPFTEHMILNTFEAPCETELMFIETIGILI